MALNSRSRYLHLIINDLITKDGEIYKLDGDRLENLKGCFNDIFEFYALIYHDLDSKKENGKITLKTPHTHIVALVRSTGKDKNGNDVFPRFSTILNRIEDCIGFRQDTMTCSVAKYWIYNCRYLLHLDHKDRHPYQLENVYSNDMDMYKFYIAQEPEIKSSTWLFDLLEECDYSLFKIMNIIGIDEYKRVRLVIQDICKASFKTLEK